MVLIKENAPLSSLSIPSPIPRQSGLFRGKLLGGINSVHPVMAIKKRKKNGTRAEPGSSDAKGRFLADSCCSYDLDLGDILAATPNLSL